MADLSILTGEPVQAHGVEEAGSMLVVPMLRFHALLGRELVFGGFVLQTLFADRRSNIFTWASLRCLGRAPDRASRCRRHGRTGGNQTISSGSFFTTQP